MNKAEVTMKMTWYNVKCIKCKKEMKAGDYIIYLPASRDNYCMDCGNILFLTFNN